MSARATGAKALLEAQRRGHERVAGGRFRIDSARAIAKLRDFRLADPHHYVLELVRAAVASEATRIDVRIDADELELSFDGRPFAELALRELFGYALSAAGDGEGVRMRLLAFGLLGALGLRPRRLELHAGGFVLDLGREGQIDVTPAPGQKGTRIYMRKRVGLRVVRNLLSGAPERTLLETHLPQLPVPLFVAGERLAASAEAAQPLIRRESRAGTRQLVAVVPRIDPAPGCCKVTLALSVHGVLVTRQTVEPAALPALVWVNDDRLRRNASGSGIVLDDPPYRALLREVDELMNDMLAALLAQLDGDAATAVRPHITASAAFLSSPDGKKISARTRQLLELAPLLPGPSGEWISIEAIKAELRSGRSQGGVRVARRRYPPELYRPPVVLLPLDPLQERLLPDRPRRDVEPEVQARIQRDRNRAAWAAQAVEQPRLPDGPWLCRGRIEVEGISGEVGLQRLSPAAQGDAPAMPGSVPLARLLLDGRLLEQRWVPALLPLELTAIVAAGFEPNETWNAAADDETLSRAIDAVRGAASAALLEALSLADAASLDALRPHGRQLAAALVGRKEALPALLKAAPLYALAGGGHTSLDEIARRDTCRTVHLSWPHAAFDGEPVVVAGAPDRDVIRALLGKDAVTDALGLLRRERDVRERLGGPREQPRLSPPVRALVEIHAEGASGELGLGEAELSRGEEPELVVTLLREGFRLGVERWKARYGPARAVVECAGLSAAPTWDGAVHDAAWQRVEAAVRAAERRAVLPLLAESSRPLRYRSPVEQAWLRAFLSGGAGESGDEVWLHVYRAPLFEGVHSLLSLESLAEAAAHAGHVFVLAPHEGHPPVPIELNVLVADPETARLVARLVKRPLAHPREEIEKRRARRAFELLPERSPRLSDEHSFRTALESPPFRGEMAVLPNAEPGAHVEILFHRRLLCSIGLAAPLGTVAVVDVEDPAVDPADAMLPQGLQRLLEQKLAEGVDRILEREAADAATAGEDPERRALLLSAIAAGLERGAAGLARAAVFPTTTGSRASFAALQAGKSIRYVTEPVSSPGGDALTVVASDEPVRRALARLGRRRRDVTEKLLALQKARQDHATRPAREEIRVPDPVRRRRAIAQDEVEGEVALVSGEDSYLLVFHERRRLCRDELPGPPGFVAAVASPRLDPRRDFAGVKHDRGFALVVERTLAEVERLIDDIATEWRAAGEGQRRELSIALGPALAWLLGRRSDEDAVFDLAVLEASAGRPLSFRDLLAEQAHRGRIRMSKSDGSLLDPEQWVWRPRPEEMKALPKGRLRLLDAAVMLARAGEVRALPRVRGLDIPSSRWSEDVVGPGIEGQAALAPAPSELSIELHVGRRLVERFSTRHAVGGTARIDGAELQPDENWTRIVRNAAFHAARAAVDAALVRCQARLLREGQPQDWEPFLDALLKEPLAPDDPRSEALTMLPAFESAEGKPVTIGELRAASSGAGSVAIVERAWARWARAHSADLLQRLGERGLLIVVGPREKERLAALRLPFHDRTTVAQREAEKLERLRTRRLADQRYPGAAIARLPVDEGGWKGELALPHPYDASAGVMLARDGIGIRQNRERNLPVAGVLEHAALAVDEDWIDVRLDEADHAFLYGREEALLEVLGSRAKALSPAERATAARYALAAAVQAGSREIRHLDRLTGAAAALSAAPVFPTSDGRWLDLRSVADHVLRGGSCAVVPGVLDPAELGPALVLLAEPRCPWLEDLAELLGRDRFVRYESPADWRRERAEREPDPADPLAAGLALLRREADLLRADASGRLSDGELTEIRLARGDGRAPLRYDAARRLVLLDPEHARVRQALADASRQPQAIYVLLAAIYGAVNRSLERVTDEDEQRLVAALMDHLAANPSLIAPSAPSARAGD